MIDAKIDKMRARDVEITEKLNRPEVLSDQQKFGKLAREQNELNQVISFYDQLTELVNQIEEDQNIIDLNEDEDLVAIANEEIEELTEQRLEMEEELKHLLIPKDPNDTKNAIIEIRAGTGGDEAAIFAGDLYRMYTKFCDRNHLKIENLSSNISERGGFKEIILNVSGESPYGVLKYESQRHRAVFIPPQHLL